jgi:hypothetical protein
VGQKAAACVAITEKNGGFPGFHRPATWPLVPLLAPFPMPDSPMRLESPGVFPSS